MKSGLKAAIIDPMKAGSLDLDCSDICLTQEASERPRVYRGPGYIRQTDDGSLIFKLYPSGDVQPIESLGTPGMLIPPERFYSFTASDTQGNVWKGNRVLPNVSISYLGGRTVSIVKGDLHALTQEGAPIPVGAVNTLSLRFFIEQKIPCHSTTVVETNAAEHRMQRSSTVNLATITSCGCDFLFTQQSGEVIVEAWSPDPFPPQFESRIIEALQFVLALPLQCRVLDSETGQGQLFHITSPVPLAKSRLQPPINLSIALAKYWTWVLFDRYLRFIVGYTIENWHPCSVHLGAMCEASAASIDAEVLGLSVAVEGLTKVLFPDIASLSEPFQNALEGFKTTANTWLKDNAVADQSGLSKRIPGLFSMLKEIRAIDRLIQLQNAGVIEKKHTDAWKILRNSAAHAAAPGTREWQQLLDRRDLVLALTYRLVFHAIGFEGRCSDYGTRDWPVTEFPQKETTEEAGEGGWLVCRTRAFGHLLQWSGNPTEGNWEWAVRRPAAEDAAESGTAANKVDACKAARTCAERRLIREVVRQADSPI